MELSSPSSSAPGFRLPLSSIPFFLVHIAAVVGVVMLGFSWSGVALCAALYFGRMFFVTGVYHRYFSHRTYKTSRWFQAVLSFTGTMCAQKGAMWWAARHRHHHKYSDTPQDIHSPRQQGFWHSHVGWILGDELTENDLRAVKDLSKYPELVWIDRNYFIGPILLGVILFWLGGAHALVWGLFVSTTLLWHGTFTINSLAHVIGRRRYETTDDSRNHWLLALITMGEGWHNNHHHYQSSERQGFYWWEIDMSHYVLTVLSWFGLVWDLRAPPQSVLEEGRRKGPRKSADEMIALVGNQALETT